NPLHAFSPNRAYTRKNQESSNQKNKSAQSHTLSPVQWPIGQSFEPDFKIWLVQRNSIHPDHPVGTRYRANKHHWGHSITNRAACQVEFRAAAEKKLRCL